MVNLSKKLILVAIATSLSIIGSVSNAAPGKSNGSGGWEPSSDHLEAVVISIKTDPIIDPEPACVALQIGTNLLMDTVKVGVNEITVTPADGVVLFTTIGGVQLINPVNQEVFDDETLCFAPYDGGTHQSLNQLLGKFIDAGGEIVVCPLCAMTRGITPAPPAKMGNAEIIHNLFLYTDKVIDF